jgi:Mrp family chromosome partitioning ATPase
MASILDAAMRMADIVIVDSPPVTAVADAVVLSRQVDGVLLVVDAGRTGREVTRESVQALERASARVLGGVLNRVPHRVSYEHIENKKDGGTSNGELGRQLLEPRPPPELRSDEVDAGPEPRVPRS